jgi:hypothetical protein
MTGEVRTRHTLPWLAEVMRLFGNVDEAMILVVLCRIMGEGVVGVRIESGASVSFKQVGMSSESHFEWKEIGVSRGRHQCPFLAHDGQNDLTAIQSLQPLRLEAVSP